MLRDGDDLCHHPKSGRNGSNHDNKQGQLLAKERSLQKRRVLHLQRNSVWHINELQAANCQSRQEAG